MYLTTWRFWILLNFFNFAAVLHKVIADGAERDNEFLRDLHGNQQSRKTNDTPIENTAITLETLERSLPKYEIDVLATEMKKLENKRKRRRYRDIIPTVASIRNDETVGQSSATLTSAIERLVPTRHPKHRHHRRCKNRLACLRSGDRDTGAAPAINSEETDVETTNERINDHRQIPQKETRNRYLEKQSPHVVTERSVPKILLEQTGNGMKGRTERYGSLQYEFDTIERKKDIDRPRIERKYDSKKTIRSEENSRSTVLASMYLPIEDHTDIHESLAALLSRLLDTLSTTTLAKGPIFLQDLDAMKNWLGNENTADDLCQKWLDSKDKLEEAFLGSPVYLPACPCQYPSSIFYDDKIWDEHQKKYFRWRDVNGDAERMDVYKPGAAYCVRSLLSQGSGNAAAQHCCYDRQRRLLTRGSGAGTPNFVSPEVSSELHERIDILPWRLCKGDFTRFNTVRPPNNDNRCKTNPDEDEYRRQIDSTKYY